MLTCVGGGNGGEEEEEASMSFPFLWRAELGLLPRRRFASRSGCVTVQGLWTVDRLQGALVVYGYERNVCIESIYKTLRGEEGRARE